MKERKSHYDWIPLWVDKWLFGSTRIELESAERAVWIDLIALASKDNGYIRANENLAYPFEQLAGMLCIPLELLQRTIEKCLSPTINKLQCLENNILIVINWEKYCLSKRHQERFMSKKADTMSKKADTIIYKEEHIKKNNIKKNKYGEYQNVLLGDEEIKKLKDQLGDTETEKWIQALDEGIELRGYKYKNHFLAIKKWVKKESRGKRFLDD